MQIAEYRLEDLRGRRIETAAFTDRDAAFLWTIGGDKSQPHACPDSETRSLLPFARA
jgi:hypothetical protein